MERFNRLCRYFLIYGRAVYFFLTLVSVLVLIGYVIIYLGASGLEPTAGKLLYMVFSLLEAILLFSVFNGALKAFDAWDRMTLSNLKNLSSISYQLIGLAAVEALSLASFFLLKVESSRVSSGFYEEGGWLAHIVKFIEVNTDMLASISSFLAPRPDGVFSLMMGVCILYFVAAARKRNFHS